jgi:hypothetical protein
MLQKLSIFNMYVLLVRSKFCYPYQRLTVCVTRAGAGGGTPSDWKNAEA